ncbi:MAG: glycosyltransferase family 2 protein [Candidatus Hydrogenedentes bacterium]|nr:glycosyltransferase family 2 protein [Candidatus Hydrogenedentota bacterium]
MSDQKPTTITVLIPVYNECGTLEPLVEGITHSLSGMRHRILFVDDGSTDGSYEQLCALRERFDTIDLIKFRRNFGKSAALAAGFARAEGDLLFTMDADLQDDPKEIPRFIEKLNEGYDLVSGWKAVRHDPWNKTFPSKVYNAIVERLTGLTIHDVNCGFKLYRMEVVKQLRIYGDQHRLIPVYAASLGYRIGEITVEHHPRTYGMSKYGFKRFSRGALDLATAIFLTHHLFTPGHFFGRVGVILGGLGGLSLLVAALGLCVKSHLVLAVLAIAGVVLIVGGLLAAGLGLCTELALRQFVDPAPYAYISEERVKRNDT